MLEVETYNRSEFASGLTAVDGQRTPQMEEAQVPKFLVIDGHRPQINEDQLGVLIPLRVRTNWVGGMPSDAKKFLRDQGVTLSESKTFAMVYVEKMDQYGAGERAVVYGLVDLHDFAYSPTTIREMHYDTLGTRRAEQLDFVYAAKFNTWLSEHDGISDPIEISGLPLPNGLIGVWKGNFETFRE